MRREREKFTVARVEREMERRRREKHWVRARSCGVGARWMWGRRRAAVGGRERVRRVKRWDRGRRFWWR